MSKSNNQERTTQSAPSQVVASKITHAILDLDSVAYVGACIAEKDTYVWHHVDGVEKSEVFKSAKEAKEWMEGLIEFGIVEPSEWTRHTVKDLRPLDIAIKGVEYELQSWMKSAKELTNNPDIKFSGYLTASGWKDKDTDGLEDRYQYNRYDPKILKETGEYVKLPSPTHLKECRNYLLTKYSWVKMSPSEKEADALVIYFTEKRGDSAVALFKDKDLKQIFAGHYIDMNDDKKDRKLVKTSELGYIETYLTTASKPKSDGRGCGFKLICYQTVRGDTADGYKGVKGVGPVAAVNMFKDLTSVEECCQVLVDFYKEKFPEPYTYTSWKGEKVTKTWQEMLDQHMRLAYHERSSKDLNTPIKRFIYGSDPIFKIN